MTVVVVRNRQQTRKVSAAAVRHLVLTLCTDHLGLSTTSLAIHLVGGPEMARLNQHFLGHHGPTDVITFDHTSLDPDSPSRPNPPLAHSRPSRLEGEVFVCIDEAIRQARLFGTSWRSELVRYVVHGLLHLCGYDDIDPPARRRMKRKENSLVRQLYKPTWMIAPPV